MLSSVPPNTVAVDYDPFAGGGELARVVSTTDAQREIWLADSLGREASLSFNESVSLRLRGALDVSALQAALQAVVCRHEALRSTLSDDGLELLVALDCQIGIETCDLTLLDDDEKALEFALRRREAVELPFEVTRGPLIRATLLKLSKLDHALILTCHHVVCDGWSFGVIVRELLGLYTANHQGPSPNLPPADGFADYSMWTAESAQLAQAAADEAWWVAQYAHDVPVLDLPVDRPRPPTRRFESEREDVLIPAELVAELRKAAAKSGASLFSLLLGFFGSLIARLSAAESVVVGVPAAGQSASGRELLVGHCVNLLPIRLNVDLAQSARDYVAKAQRSVLDAYDHQQVTFGSILSKLRIERDPSRLPLVSVQFNLDQRIAPEDLAQPGLEATLDTNARAFENFEIFVNATQAPEGIVLETQYSAALFDGSTIRRWMEIYRDALGRFVASPSKSLRELFIPTAADLGFIERQNRTDAAYDTSAVVHGLFAETSVRSSQSPAIVWGNDTLHYGELDTRSNRLARLLRSRGVGRGSLVGLCLPRTADMVIGQLAVLKAGAAYVPLDPAFPPDRLAYMAEDAKLSLLVTTASLSSSVAWSRDASIWVDADAESIAQQSGAVLEADATRDARPLDPAYVIYTSGSTGKPKGVVVHHRAVVNFLASMAKQPGMKAGDRVVAVTTLSFDIAVLELLLPLSVGATIVLASRDQAIDGAALKTLLEQSQASLMQATPATWRLLIEAGWRAAPPFKALVGGEGLPQDLARELASRVGELWNMYGPTETTVWSTCWKVDPAAAAIRIGTPIDNTQVHVLDEKMQPCPIGVAGEIFIGGDGVTLGYLGLPKLTDERFIPDPFRAGTDSRLYRTGDRGRWCADGQLEHLGRLDFQVKVRGFRIELGEIEARLAAHEAVAQNVVIVREDQPGDVRLVAYLVAKAPVPEAGELKKFLRTHLPEYMLPQHFVTLDALPLTPNGKVDRKRLPPPTDSGEGAARGARVAPRNDLEHKVLQAMEAVLNQRSLGITDDFFSLGGHSLLAARLIGQINRSLGLQLGLRVMFEAPTAEKIAKVIAQEQGADAPRRAPIAHRANQESAPLTLMQERIHFIERMQPGRVVYNAPSAHRLRGPMNLEAFNRAFVEMTRRQTVLRTAVVETPDGYIQRVDDSADTHLPVEDLATVAEADRERVLLERIEAGVAHSFELSKAPLFRARLFKMGAEDYAMLFMPHHVIWDGSSFDIFYEDLSALYEAFLAGKPSPLPPLQVTYGDFAQWHREWMQSDEIAGQMAWWKQQFASFPELAEPYPDLPRRAAATGNGGTEFLHIPTQRAEEIREIAKRTGSTVNIVLLSVYSALVSQWLRDPNPAVGIPVRGRPSPELEATMGFFNNMVPLRLPVAMSSTALEWIRQVRQLVTAAFANQDVPFEMLAQESTRLYQVMFTLQDARHRRTHWGQLNHTRIPVMQKGATEDINLWLIEVPNGIEGGVQYNADLFLSGTAAALRDRFLELLGRLVANPDQSLDQLLALRPEEEALVAAWSAPARPAARAQDAIDALWERIKASPDRTAVSKGGARLTNRQLCGHVERAERLLKAALPNLVAGERETVAIGSADVLVHLAAGLAAARLGLRSVSFGNAADSGAVFERPDLVAVVWDAGVTAAVPANVLRVEAGDIVAGSPLKGAGTSRSSKRAAATAVALDRTMLCAWLESVGNLLALGEDAKVLCFEGPARVHPWLQTLHALVTGGELLLVSSDLSRDGAGLAALIRDERVTHLNASAAVLQRLLSTRTGVLPKVVQLDVTESTPELVAGLLEAGTRVISACSPSDLGLPVAATVVTDARECRAFGRPLLAISVKDERGRAAFVQTPGELCVGSPLRGTQSLVRWRQDGQLQYLGEIDGAAYVDGERVSREELAARLALEGPAARSSAKAIVPPGNPVEKAIADIWCELLNIREVSVEDNFFDLGGRSLLGVQMLGHLERHFGVNLPLSTLLQRQTVAALAELLSGNAAGVEKTRAAAAWRPLVEIQKGSGTRPPLFCMHAVGGNVLQYRGLAAALPKDQPVYGLQSIGLDGLTRPLESIEEMCRIYCAEVRRVQPHGPYYLCGGSMGGTLAFEMARQFEAAGERVALLALFDTAGPEVKRLSGQEQSGARSVRRLFGAVLSGNFNLKHSVTVRWRERSDALTAKWYWMRNLPVPQEVRWRVVEAANYRASAAYVERPYNGVITLFRALDEHDQRHLSADLGWSAVGKGGVEIISLPGTHREFIEQPDLPPALREALLKAQANPAESADEAERTTQARKVG
jgi:amino acid adenylation domain-containing protein